jgi:hypothetical protein
MKTVSFLVLAALYNVAAMAQSAGGSTSVDVNLKGDSGGGGYWMWIIGAIVLIVLLVVLMGGRGGTDRVVEKRTVIRD